MIEELVASLSKSEKRYISIQLEKNKENNLKAALWKIITERTDVSNEQIQQELALKNAQHYKVLNNKLYNAILELLVRYSEASNYELQIHNLWVESNLLIEKNLWNQAQNRLKKMCELLEKAETVVPFQYKLLYTVTENSIFQIIGNRSLKDFSELHHNAENVFEEVKEHCDLLSLKNQLQLRIYESEQNKSSVSFENLGDILDNKFLNIQKTKNELNKFILLDLLKTYYQYKSNYLRSYEITKSLFELSTSSKYFSSDKYNIGISLINYLKFTALVGRVEEAKQLKLKAIQYAEEIRSLNEHSEISRFANTIKLQAYYFSFWFDDYSVSKEYEELINSVFGSINNEDSQSDLFIVSNMALSLIYIAENKNKKALQVVNKLLTLKNFGKNTNRFYTVSILRFLIFWNLEMIDELERECTLLYRKALRNKLNDDYISIGISVVKSLLKHYNEANEKVDKIVIDQVFNYVDASLKRDVMGCVILLAMIHDDFLEVKNIVLERLLEHDFAPVEK
jgi:hypothetical protein